MKRLQYWFFRPYFLITWLTDILPKNWVRGRKKKRKKRPSQQKEISVVFFLLITDFFFFFFFGYFDRNAHRMEKKKRPKFRSEESVNQEIKKKRPYSYNTVAWNWSFVVKSSQNWWGQNIYATCHRIEPFNLVWALCLQSPSTFGGLMNLQVQVEGCHTAILVWVRTPQGLPFRNITPFLVKMWQLSVLFYSDKYWFFISLSTSPLYLQIIFTCWTSVWGIYWLIDSSILTTALLM